MRLRSISLTVVVAVKSSVALEFNLKLIENT